MSYFCSLLFKYRKIAMAIGLGIGSSGGWLSWVDSSPALAEFRAEQLLRIEEVSLLKEKMGRVWSRLEKCCGELLEVIRRVFVTIANYAEGLGLSSLESLANRLADISTSEKMVSLPPLPAPIPPLPPQPLSLPRKRELESRVSLEQSSDDVVESASAVPIKEIRGIANIGNSCYCNAVLQALIASPLFRTTIEELDLSKEEDPQRRSVLEVLKQFYDNYCTPSEGAPVLNARMMRLLRRAIFNSGLNWDFSGNITEQKDAAVLLELLLDLLNLRFPLQSILNGDYFDRGLGKKNTFERAMADSASLLSVEMRQGHSFQELIDGYFASEDHVDDIKNIYRHEYETVEGESYASLLSSWSRRLALDSEQLPFLLPIQLKRFAFTSRGAVKISDKVPFPEDDLFEICGVKYRLRAVVSHLGRSVSGGHYISYIRQEERWFVCDDRDVYEVDSEEVPRDRGYCFLFERVE